MARETITGRIADTTAWADIAVMHSEHREMVVTANTGDEDSPPHVQITHYLRDGNEIAMTIDAGADLEALINALLQARDVLGAQ